MMTAMLVVCLEVESSSFVTLLSLFLPFQSLCDTQTYCCPAAAGQRMGQLHQRGEPFLPCLHWSLQWQAVQQEAE